mgnify:CR=1 FL=1
MKLTSEIKEYLDKSVLCWLATSSATNEPNVSPKECFTYFGTDQIIIANIASPQSVRNILTNENVCVSFLEVFVQKGFQIKGKAQIIDQSHVDYQAMFQLLDRMTKGKFPFNTITAVTVEHVKPIIAPSYKLFPDTTEESIIEVSKRTYGVQ